MCPAPIIPLNQQRSFPIQTVAAAASADTITISGGQVTMFWGPSSGTARGSGMLSATTTTDANGHVFLVTNFFTAAGCSNFALLASRFNGTAVGLGALPASAVYVQYRLTPATVMPTSQSAGAFALDQCGMVPIVSTSLTWPVMALGNTEYGLVTWGPSADAGTSAVINPATIGTDFRIFLSFGGTAVNANNAFSLSLWGSS